MRRLFLTVHAVLLTCAVMLLIGTATPAQGETQELTTETTTEASVSEEATSSDEVTAESTEETVAEETTDTTEDTQAADATTTDEAEDTSVAEADETAATVEETAADEQEESVTDEADDSEVTLTVQDTTSAAQAALDAYAAKHANDLANGRYRIATILNSGLSLSVSGASTSNGGKVVVWTAATAKNQRWDIESVSGGYVTIQNVNSGKYLDIAGSDAGLQDGVRVVQWAERDSSSRSQLWIIVRTSSGYRIVSGVAAADGKRLVLTVKGGTGTKGSLAVLSYESSTASSQLWKFSVTTDILNTLAAEHEDDLEDGLYVFNSELNPGGGKQLMLSVKSASLSNKAAAIVAGRTASATKVHDVWSVRHTSKGYLIITNLYTDKALHVSGGTAKEKTPIFQYTDKNGKYRSQLWIAVKQDDGSYKLISALAGDHYLALQVSGSKATSGTKTILANSTTRSSQNWTLGTVPDRYEIISELNNTTYLIKTSLNLSKTLTVYKGYKAAGIRVPIATSSNAPKQCWKLTYDYNGYAHFTNQNSSRQLGFNASGVAVQVAGKYRWLIEESSNDLYTIRSKTGAYSGKYLTLKDGKTANNTSVIAAAANGAGSQLWYLDNMTEGLDGVDISGWNTGINYSKLGDFVIIKATEWNEDKNSYTTYNDYQDKADKALAAGKLIGFYHFATNPSTSGQSMAKQAAGFIKAVSVKDSSGNYKYLGKAVLFLDWEDTSYSTVESTKGVTWAKQWLDYVYKKTGIKPLIYMNKNCSISYDWSSVANAGYDLWGAQYLNKYYSEYLSSMITSFVEYPTLTTGWGAWGTPVIYQYTATARLHGSKYYDVNKFYGTKADWYLRASAS